MKIKYNGIEYEAQVNEKGQIIHESEGKRLFFGFMKDGQPDLSSTKAELVEEEQA